jgi:hypothetical protein
MYQTSGIEQVLGALGTTFRLTRLYPPSHPAVIEAMRHIADALAGVAGDGALEWKVGATGLHLQGQQLAPRNAQIAELAGLLFTRGVRGIELRAGVTPEHLLALTRVATGAAPPDDPSLGRITLQTSRRTTQRLAALNPPAAGAATAGGGGGGGAGAGTSAPVAPAGRSAAEQLAPRRSAPMFRPDVLPADVETRRALSTLRTAEAVPERLAAVQQIAKLAPDLLALRDVGVVAEIISGLDDALLTASDPGLIDGIEAAAAALSEPATVGRPNAPHW